MYAESAWMISLSKGVEAGWVCVCWSVDCIYGEMTYEMGEGRLGRCREVTLGTQAN
jgi:hypothetical protein